MAYGVEIVGLCVSACLYIHIGSKYLFVRALRNSPHLQLNSVVHWATWLSITAGVSALSFVVASGIPIFNYILALAGSLCFAPLAISLPAYLWLHDHSGWRTGGVSEDGRLDMELSARSCRRFHDRWSYLRCHPRNN